MHAAIAAAREAFDTGPWERERADVLRRTADLIDRDRKDFSRAEALDTGKRLVEAGYDIDDVVACFRYYGGIAGTDSGRVVDTGRTDAHQPDRVCPGRRLRADHPVELPSAAGVVEGRAGAAGRQHLRPQTVRADSVDRDPADGHLAEAGLPAGVANWSPAPDPRSARC